MRKFVVILTIILLYSVACKKEDFLWDLPRGECNFVYSAWSSWSPNNIQTRTYTSSPPECTSKPPQDSIQRLCVVLPSVKIGSQTWTSKNLDVSTYRNGEAIPEVQAPQKFSYQAIIAWANLTTGAWCYYENNTANGIIYGKLYNWYAVNDPRGLAPKGYHIPTDAEWTILSDYLGGESVAGKKMKNTTGWQNNGNGTNTSGFAGLPGGYRNYDGVFLNIDTYGNWWTSTAFAYRGLDYAYDNFNRANYVHQRGGFSVRCIKD